MRKTSKPRDLAGVRVGYLVGVKITGRSKAGYHLWECVCDCGKTATVESYRLNRGEPTSCGCLKFEMNSKAHRKHGMFGTPTYKTWDAIIERCLNPNANGYEHYGGRGIKVCMAIRSSAVAIVNCIGLKPDGLSIDRKDNDGHYSCGRCSECQSNGWPLNIRWATPKQQLRNTRVNRIIEIGGVRKCLAQWADDTGLTRLKISQRIKRGWPESRWLEGAL